jgi:RNA polymerase sigma factor (sigma-70 family)
MKKLQDHELILRIEHGENNATDEIYRRYQGRIKSFLRKHGASKSVADDIYIETIQNLWLKVRKEKYIFQLSLDRYLYGVARRLFLKRCNKFREIFYEWTLLDAFTKSYVDPESELNNSERTRLIQDALSNLSPRKKEIIQLYYFDDCTMKQIANSMKLKNANTAKVLKYKALQDLRSLIGKDTAHGNFW